MYSDVLMSNFFHPRNVGFVESPDAVARVKYPPCSDFLELSVRMANGRGAEARFRVQGCGAAVAAGSVLTELMKGRGRDEMASITLHDIVNALGGLPEGKIHAAQMALDAVRLVIEQLAFRRPVPPLKEGGEAYIETTVRR